ncbi:MAG TPA: heparinase II/III family protein [Gaiellaceae bacterium]|nr:heparinase II/III family protein [Gaiellaceae bacterium]
MMLHLHALRAARARQLRARALRPLVRRRFPDGAPPRPAEPIPSAADLWWSDAFEASSPPDASTRLGRFHRQYGDDVLAAARAGDAPEARRLIDTWIEAHPPHRGDAWHPYPLSTRVGNWIAALTLLPELASERLSQSLWRQLLRLAANVEDDVLGNHVIRNARALVLGGVSFGAADLTRRGIELLRRELPEQVLRDGGHYERSPAYHLVVLRDLLEVQAASPYSWIADAIERMRAFAAALARPDGAPALFNDGTVDAPRLELPDAPEGLAVFDASGFVVVRDGPLWLAFRCGPPSPPFLPAHAHADALSLQLWWRGRPVLVDAGTYTYEPGADRDFFRSTRAHSTLVVDGRDQFRLWGAFRSGPLPKVALRYAREHAVEASVVLPGRLRHVRRIEWADDEVEVHDRLEGRGRHRVESRLVWAPDPPPVEFDLLGPGELRTDETWVSERFGERVPTSAAVVLTDLELPGSIGFRLRCLD